VLLIGTVQWGPTTRRIRENASDQSVEDGLGLDDQVSGDHHTKKSIVLDITHEGYKDARTDRLSARGGGFSASGGGKGDTY
jgi:hypothetical protein